MRRFGFTGTRNGLTIEQTETIEKWIKNDKNTLPEDCLVHGDCVGADATAHDIALSSGLFVHVFPPKNKIYRAFCRRTDRVVVHDEAEYLVRNRCIVNDCSVLIAAPKELQEQRFGGTWYTVRYARQQGRPIVFVWPDGSTTTEGKL